jgi:YqxM protein
MLMEIKYTDNYKLSIKDVVIIRTPRSNKYGRRRWKSNMLIKIIAILYITILTCSFLNENTGAYFNDSQQLTGKIQAGTWEVTKEQWDKSSLMFLNKEISQRIEKCSPVDLTVLITNTGSDMQGPSEYEVYYIEKGKKDNGKIVGKGTIEPIASNKNMILSFTANTPGKYQFRAFQRPFHNFTSERKDLWSESIILECSKDLPQENTNSDIEDIKVNKETDTQSKESKVNKDTDTQREESKVNKDTDTQTKESKVNKDIDTQTEESKVNIDTDTHTEESKVNIEKDTQTEDSEVNKDTDTQTEDSEVSKGTTT